MHERNHRFDNMLREKHGNIQLCNYHFIFYHFIYFLFFIIIFLKDTIAPELGPCRVAAAAVQACAELMRR
jgi:hypothetical protein